MPRRAKARLKPNSRRFCIGRAAGRHPPAATQGLHLPAQSRAWKQLIRGFVQVLIGAVRVRQMSDQFSGKLVNVDASKVVKLLSLEIEDGRAKDDRYVDTTAVEYFSVHDLPPIGGPAASACASGSRATAPTTC